MSQRRKTAKKTIEFGDFQTPRGLASSVCRMLAGRGLSPASVVEPTCGEGSFLIAALQRFPKVAMALGADINPSHLRRARSAIAERGLAGRTRLICADFFEMDWPRLLGELPDPLLLIGNPPWVTSAKLSTLGSDNSPRKSNFQRRRGLDAITGKANFDISEWMLIRLLDWLNGRRAIVAMLCKTAVARKALAHAWGAGVALNSAAIYAIDARQSFAAAVDACLLVCELAPGCYTEDARVYSGLESGKEASVLGFRDGRLIADSRNYDRWKHLAGSRSLQWRSGIKHDCSRVMELLPEGGRYRNGLRELVDLEETYLYPMLKGSDVAKGWVQTPKRWMLVTQTCIGQDTGSISRTAPKTWQYLQAHGEMLDRRASSVYRKHPRFSIFGVGGYTFAPWKVAIPALYKRLDFAVTCTFREKPIVLDDTCYFAPCQSREDAEYVASLLNSLPSREFFSSFVFWEAKRPITAEILGQLDLVALATELRQEPGRAERLLQWSSTAGVDDGTLCRQQELFPADA